MLWGSLFRSYLRNSLDFLAIRCEIYVMKRAQQDIIVKDLKRKMVFTTGPRQVGKTSLALAISDGCQKSLYLNYDGVVKSPISFVVGFLQTLDIPHVLSSP